MAEITTLISNRDASEIIRDKLADIILAEVAGQQALATLQAQDPLEWGLRVFLERSNPWAEFQDASDDDLDTTPIVNIQLDNYNVDTTKSNVVSRQKCTAIYHIDCYGFGVSESEVSGHKPGDWVASIEAQRAVRLVRNILMAAHYTYLGLQGTVWRRMLQGVQVFQPPQDGRTTQHVVGARMSFEVGYSEFSPQVAGEPLELISMSFLRAENGEVFLPEQVIVAADFDHSTP